MKELIEYLEGKIEGCDSLGGMEKEKWAFIQCLKEAKKKCYIPIINQRSEILSCDCPICGKEMDSQIVKHHHCKKCKEHYTTT